MSLQKENDIVGSHHLSHGGRSYVLKIGIFAIPSIKTQVTFFICRCIQCDGKTLETTPLKSVNELKTKLDISDLQDIFRDNQRLFEKVLDELKVEQSSGRSDATQPQHKQKRPREEKKPPKVNNLKQGV